MAEINFDDNTTTSNAHRSNYDDTDDKSGLTGTVQEKLGISCGGAQKVLAIVGVIAFLVSLYFWFSLL